MVFLVTNDEVRPYILRALSLLIFLQFLATPTQKETRDDDAAVVAVAKEDR